MYFSSCKKVGFLSHFEFSRESGSVVDGGWLGECFKEIHLIGISDLEVLGNWHIILAADDMVFSRDE